TRTVNLHDGKIVSDSDPFEPETEAQEKAVKGEKKKKNKTSMSFFTALSLSLNNLLTKKARTILTSFAGSIGIIGIALILSLKSGFDAYIIRLQEDTLSSYPIVIQNETMDVSALLTELSDDVRGGEPHGLDKVYSRPVFGKLINSVLSGIRSNDMTSFRAYIEANRAQFEQYTSDIKYGYGLTMNVYTESKDGNLIKVNPLDTVMSIYNRGGSSESPLMRASNNGSEAWSELLDNRELLDQQYETVYGKWPDNMHEAVLFVNKNNEISDLALCALGLLDQDEVARMMRSAVAGEKISDESVKSFSYEEICATEFMLIPAPMKYRLNEATGLWEDRGNDKTYLKWAAKEYGETIRIVGIMRPRENAVSAGSSTIGYTSDLTKYCLAVNNGADIVKQQASTEINRAASEKYGKEYRNCDIDVFTGIPFDYVGEQKEITLEDVYAYIASLPEPQQAQVAEAIKNMSEQEILAAFAGQIGGSGSTDATYEYNMRLLGAEKTETPSSISIYANSFAAKDELARLITEYNEKAEAEGKPEKVIRYTDYIGLVLSSVSTIIDTISYVLIAFVSVSLIVSSIMIGVITYISVLERTKEIGILRSLGASRRDISRVFNAETLIVGFISGVMGILGTLLLNIPVNAIIKSLSRIDNMAQLPLLGALALVAVSMIMTFIAGLIPSGLAARRDPVVALRTE
ncbi:MAG: ABC transporter permease, partial [Clostridia bacterium]|nr:ABC transporter permease [Clostridia bacterium]